MAGLSHFKRLKNNQRKSKMAKGGLRPGAGRKPGVRNKRTAAKVAEVEASGLTPLDYLLTVLRDEALDREARVDAAKAAAPYVHARLAAVEHSTDPDAPMGFTFTWQQPSG